MKIRNPTHMWTTCPDCGKRSWRTRAAAKAVARVLHDPGLSAAQLADMLRQIVDALQPVAESLRQVGEATKADYRLSDDRRARPKRTGRDAQTSTYPGR